MVISGSTKEALKMLAGKLPPEKREKFREAISARLDELSVENTLEGALSGAFVGAILEALPGFELISGIDDCVEVGTALGAWSEHRKSKKVKEERERVANAIRDALNETFS